MRRAEETMLVAETEAGVVEGEDVAEAVEEVVEHIIPHKYEDNAFCEVLCSLQQLSHRSKATRLC